jgi:hypothetical protein
MLCPHALSTLGHDTGKRHACYFLSLHLESCYFQRKHWRPVRVRLGQANNDAIHPGVKTVRMPPTGSLLQRPTTKSPIVAASIRPRLLILASCSFDRLLHNHDECPRSHVSHFSSCTNIATSDRLSRHVSEFGRFSHRSDWIDAFVDSAPASTPKRSRPAIWLTPQAKGIVDDCRLAQPIRFTCGGFIKTFGRQDTCTSLQCIEPQYTKNRFFMILAMNS